jgi:hypothetical protein
VHFILALILVLWAPSEARQSTDRLITSVTLIGDFELEFTVTWTGNRDLRLYEADLPWGTVYSAIIVAVTDTGEVLRRTLPIDDPGPATAVLRPGVPSKGRVQLLRMFPQLKGISSQTEVVVFWSYQPKGIAEISREGGWVSAGKR